MKPKSLLITLLALISINAQAQFKDPFSFTTQVDKTENETILSVSFSVPDKLYLYQNKISVQAGETALTPLKNPETVEKKDPISGEPIQVYTSDVTFKYNLPSPYPETVTINYQGCDEKQCFFPQSKEISIDPKTSATPATTKEQTNTIAATENPAASEEFVMTGRAAGYLPVDKFIEFLDETESGEGLSKNHLSEIFEKSGAWALILLVLLFGLGLNLTPCVLPMIPVNIAIIGAGAQAGSRVRGFALGATYGLGISLAYGLLGLLFVITGTKFGTLNASPVFNIAIGLIFLALSLAMFGVFNLDLTRFQGKIGTGGNKKGSFITALALGAIAALLAGACVAPVIISTLVFALDVYNKGNTLGLMLPFLLGVGMALPWPFAGAGLSFLPKAGGWMEKIKYGFGVIIIAAALYYIGLGVKLAIANSQSSKAQVAAVAGKKEDWLNSLDEGMRIAHNEDKPLFIDFWASWCKNCLTMEKTTFQDEEVLKRLDSYVKVKFDSSDQSKPEVKTVLDKYVTVGLPTYVILEVKK